MADLSQKQRDKMPSKLFALPSKKMFPINDETHVRLAWDMVDRAKGLSDAERAEARRNILKRAKELGIDTSDWDKKLKAGVENLNLHARSSSVLLGTLEHPNKMPFSGIFTYFDAPSDEAPGGANGRRVVIPAKVGIPALESLKGMAVNYSENWDDHNPQEKIGVITNVWAGERQADGAIPVHVEGYIYSLDFYDAAVNIKANQSQLGFSYETANTRLVDGEWNGEPVAIVTDLGYFTGASILLKKSAAYKTTSIAASAEQKGGNEEMEQKLDQILAAVGNLDQRLASLEASAQAAPHVENKPEEQPTDLQALAAELKKQILEELKAELTKQQNDLQAAARRSVPTPLYQPQYNTQEEEEQFKSLMASIENDPNLSITERFAKKMELLQLQNNR